MIHGRCPIPPWTTGMHPLVIWQHVTMISSLVAVSVQKSNQSIEWDACCKMANQGHITGRDRGEQAIQMDVSPQRHEIYR